ncbi:MAG: hypothetical protein FWD47_04405 [Treponema sp.]|nr:hypothetical protein [Treponema sp.]
MKKWCLFLFIVLLFTSCELFDFGYIEDVIVHDSTTIYIYFTGNIQEFDHVHDVRIVVNDTNHTYRINSSSYNIFTDNFGFQKRYRCKLNKNLLLDDKIEVIGVGRSVFGRAVTYYSY